MHRKAGLSFGVALAFAVGLTAAACGQGDTSETNSDAAPRVSEVEQTAQTTPATQPVVTVYKSPT